MERDVTTLLATVHLVLNDMGDFLQKCLQDAGAVGETKLLFKSMLDHFLTHSEWVKDVVFSPAMDYWAVSTRVSTALSALRPLTAYSFSGVLSETAQCLGLSPPPGEEEQPANPVEPGSVRLEMRVVVCDILKAERLWQPSWYEPRALHLNYSEDFTMQRPEDISPVLTPTLFDNVKAEIEQLKKFQATVPSVGVPVLGVDKLWEELCDTPSEDRKAKFQVILQSYQKPSAKTEPQPGKRPGKAPAGGVGTGLTLATSGKGSKDQPAPLGGGGPSVPPVKPEDQPGQPANSDPKGWKRPKAELQNPKVDPKGPVPVEVKKYKIEGITIPEGIVKKSLSVSISISWVLADGSFSIKSPKGTATASGGGGQAIKTEPEGNQDQPKPDPIQPPEDDDLPKEDRPKSSGVATKASRKARAGSSKEEQ